MRRWILSTVYYKNEFLDSSQTITIIKNGRDRKVCICGHDLMNLLLFTFSKIFLHRTLICINSNVPERTV